MQNVPSGVQTCGVFDGAVGESPHAARRDTAMITSRAFMELLPLSDCAYNSMTTQVTGCNTYPVGCPDEALTL